MDNARNLRIYRLWSPLYDLLFRPLSARARQRAMTLLNLQPGEVLLIPGVGTGLDLPLLPERVSATGVDLSPAMLAKARPKAAGRAITLLQGDVQHLDFPDGQFDAVLLNLVLSVVPDGAAAFEEAWRTLRPGGRAVIFDKFLPAGAALTFRRRLIGRVVRAFGTNPNCRLHDVIGAERIPCITHNTPSLLGGQYRIVRIEKPITT